MRSLGFALASLFVQDQPKGFPTSKGTTWKYEVQILLNDKETGRLEIHKSISGPGQVIVGNTALRAIALKVSSLEGGTSLPNDDEFVVVHKKMFQLYRLQGSRKKEHVLIFAFPAEPKIGRKVKGVLDRDAVEVTVFDQEEIQVPAGRYLCWKIGYRGDDRSVYLWFAEGVGIVKYERTAQGGHRRETRGAQELSRTQTQSCGKEEEIGGSATGVALIYQAVRLLSKPPPSRFGTGGGLGPFSWEPRCRLSRPFDRGSNSRT